MTSSVVSLLLVCDSLTCVLPWRLQGASFKTKKAKSWIVDRADAGK